jgi:hypothetical protein
MALNKMEDLRNHLFAALERLNDESLPSAQIADEIKKAKAISEISNSIVDTAKVEIEFLQATQQLNSGSQLFKSVIPEKEEFTSKFIGK